MTKRNPAGKPGCNWKGESIHALANSSEAVKNLIRVNSWNSWRLYWPRISRISRKQSLSFGCHWFEIRFFTVSPAALLDSHFTRFSWWTRGSQIGQVSHGRDGHATKPSWHGVSPVTDSEV